jgi:hypothetical protein
MKSSTDKFLDENIGDRATYELMAKKRSPLFVKTIDNSQTSPRSRNIYI